MQKLDKLNKSSSQIKVCTKIWNWCNSKIVGTDKSNSLHILLLANGKVSGLPKNFENSLSKAIKLPKT